MHTKLLSVWLTDSSTCRLRLKFKIQDNTWRFYNNSRISPMIQMYILWLVFFTQFWTFLSRIVFRLNAHSHFLSWSAKDNFSERERELRYLFWTFSKEIYILSINWFRKFFKSRIYRFLCILGGIRESLINRRPISHL